MVGLYEELSPGLRCCVWVRGFQNMFLIHCLSFERLAFTVHLIRRYMDETTNALVILGRLQQNMRAHNVTLGKVERIPKRIVNMCLCRKVNNSINILLRHNVRHKVWTANITLDEFKVFKTSNLAEICETGTVVQFVIHNHIIMRILLRQEDGRMRSDESFSVCKDIITGLVRIASS